MAGVDDTKDNIILKAMEKIQSVLKKAQLILFVLDSSADLEKQFGETKLEGLTNNVIVIINKCDLQKDSHCSELPMSLKNYPAVHTSALTGKGLERLKETLVESVLCGKINTSATPPMLNMRQREALRQSLQSVQQAIESTKNQESYEFIALNLHAAIDTLGEIMGKTTTEDILDKIFSEFCIGK